MALLTITAVPGEAQRELFDLWLQAGDVIVVREDARPLMWQPNPTPARGCIRQADADALGGQRHPDWAAISDQEWADLIAEHQPQLTW